MGVGNGLRGGGIGSSQKRQRQRNKHMRGGIMREQLKPKYGTTTYLLLQLGPGIEEGFEMAWSALCEGLMGNVSALVRIGVACVLGPNRGRDVEALCFMAF